MARFEQTRAIIAGGLMSNDLWRWAAPDGQQRRVHLDELRAALASGAIAPNTPVWRSGWVAWQPAHDVPELTTSALSAANGVVPNIPPPPLAVVAVQHAFEAQAGVPSLSGDAEPPAPPPYVPAPVKPSRIPPAPTSPARGRATQVLPSGGSTPAPAREPSSPVVGPSHPTTIGLPPPPELVAAVAQAKAGAGTPPPPPAQRRTPTKPPPSISRRPPPPVPIEELTASELEAAAPSDPSVPVGAGAFVPALASPTVSEAPPAGEESVAGLSPSPGLSDIFADLRALRAGQKPKNRLLVPVLGLVGGAVVITLLAAVVSAFRGEASEVATSGSASPLTSATPPSDVPEPTAASSAAAVAAPAAAAAKVQLGPCTLGGEERLIAPRAIVASGIEAAALDGNLALGFAPQPGAGTAVALDPSSLAVVSTARARNAPGDVRRVTPVRLNGKLGAFADGERKGDKLASRRSIATPTPIDVGVAESAIVWAPHGKDGWAKIAAVEGEGPVEALRAVPLSSKRGIAIAFRRDGAVWLGAAVGEGVLEMPGGFAKLDGLGQVGSPALTTSGDTIIAAWADRADPESAWQVRWTKMTLGGAPAPASSFELPPGGLGERVMSPAVFGLGGGRFVIAWTEGPVAQHQVRAITLDENGKPMGSAIQVSAEGVNAGQPQVAVGPDGRGLVAFLASKGKGFELRATPLQCGK